MSKRTSSRPGFTLLELMVVIIVIAIIAAITLPMVQNMSKNARESALRCELRSLRNQILMYQLHHNGNLPAPAQLTDLLMQRTNVDGTIDSQGRCGPYLVTFPSNPYNGRTDVKIVADGHNAAADDSSGWLYGVDQSSFTIVANSTGQDRSGVPLTRY